MRKKSIQKLISSVAAFSMVVASLVTMPGIAFAQVANPSLGDACDGLDIALVIDTSGSIGSTNMATVRTAAKDFVDAFLANTPSLVGVVSFNTSATTNIGLTNNQANLDTAIDGLVSGGNTNWAQGLEFGRVMLETTPDDRDDSINPDLMVVFTDGQPNLPVGDPLGDAVAQADLAKGSSSSQPIRIIAVGVGGATQANLEAITGGVGTSNVATSTAAISLATDVIMTNFDDLGTTLANLASALCNEPPDDCGCLGPVDVINLNQDTTVINGVHVGASTGGNDANGGSGGSGGSSGSADVNGTDGDNNTATSGAGGAGGNGGSGGGITTGNASAGSLLGNVVNTNSTTITRGGTTSVLNANVGTFNGNFIGVKAKTGWNATDGGSAGSGGTSGSATVSSADDDNTATSGAGGAGGNGGNGGTTSTGIAGSLSDIFNQINFNLVVIN